MNQLKIPVYEVYRMVLVFPSASSPSSTPSPFPSSSPASTASSTRPSAPRNLRVSLIIKVCCMNHHLFFKYQGGSNLYLLTNEKKRLQHTGEYIFAPYFEEHDYVIVPSNTAGVLYYDNDYPQCLHEFKFMAVLKQPEVKN